MARGGRLDATGPLRWRRSHRRRAVPRRGSRRASLPASGRLDLKGDVASGEVVLRSGGSRPDVDPPLPGRGRRSAQQVQLAEEARRRRPGRAGHAAARGVSRHRARHLWQADGRWLVADRSTISDASRSKTSLRRGLAADRRPRTAPMPLTTSSVRSMRHRVNGGRSAPDVPIARDQEVQPPCTISTRAELACIGADAEHREPDSPGAGSCAADRDPRRPRDQLWFTA